MTNTMSKTEYDYTIYKTVEYFNEVYGTGFKFGGFSGNHVDIMRMNDSYTGKDNEAAVFGVNWGALGTKTVEETREFAEHLTYAARLVGVLNNMELAYDYDIDDEEFVNRAIDSAEKGLITDAQRKALEKLHII